MFDLAKAHVSFVQDFNFFCTCSLNPLAPPGVTFGSRSEMDSIAPTGHSSQVTRHLRTCPKTHLTGPLRDWLVVSYHSDGMPERFAPKTRTSRSQECTNHFVPKGAIEWVSFSWCCVLQQPRQYIPTLL